MTPAFKTSKPFTKKFNKRKDGAFRTLFALVFFGNVNN